MLDLINETNAQTGLFDTCNRARGRLINSTLDSLNKTFGKDTVQYAIQGFERRYRLRANHLSQRYTTNFNELLHVSI